MLAIFLFERYLKKLDDYKFVSFWEKRVQGRGRFYFLGLFIYYIVAVGLISQVLLFGSQNVFFDILVTLFTMIVYGYYLLRNSLRFIAIENNRYMTIKLGSQSETFSKDNVVN